MPLMSLEERAREKLNRMSGAQPVTDTAPPQPSAAPTWEQIASSPLFQSHDDATKESVRNKYFDDFVAPNVPTDKIQSVRASFDADTKGAWKSPTALDYGKALVASGAEAIGTIPQMVGEGAAYVANKVTGTEDYQGFNPLESTATNIRKTMTPGGKAAVADIASGDVMSPDTWEMPETKAGLAMTAIQGMGSLSTWVIPGAWALKAAKLAKAGNVAAAARAAKIATVAGAATGGLSTGGDAAGDARRNVTQALSGMSHDQLLADVPIYTEAYQRTGNEAAARSAVINRAGLYSGLLASTVGAAEGAVGGGLLGRIARKKGIPGLDAIKSTPARIATGAVVGAPIEAAQETVEKSAANVGENVALGRDALEDVTRNTFPEALGGALVGGPVGAGGGVAGKSGDYLRQPLPQGAKPVAPDDLQSAAASLDEGQTAPEPPQDIAAAIQAIGKGGKLAAYSQDPAMAEQALRGLGGDYIALQTNDGGVLITTPDNAETVKQAESAGQRHAILGYSAPKPTDSDGNVIQARDQNGGVAFQQLVNKGTPEEAAAIESAKRIGTVERTTANDALAERASRYAESSPATQEDALRNQHKQVVDADYSRALEQREQQRQAEEQAARDAAFKQIEAQRQAEQDALIDHQIKRSAQAEETPTAMQLAFMQAKQGVQAPNDVLSAKKKPFKTRGEAMLTAKLKKLPEHTPVQVGDGQWVLRKQEKALSETSSVTSDIVKQPDSPAIERYQWQRNKEAVQQGQSADSEQPILTSKGKPFKTEKEAVIAIKARKLADHAPAPVDGGWGITKQQSAESKPNANEIIRPVAAANDVGSVAQDKVLATQSQKAIDPEPQSRSENASVSRRTEGKVGEVGKNPNVKTASGIDPVNDDLLAAIAKAGGLSRGEAKAQGIDPAHFNRRGWRIKRVFTTSGQSFDAMAERLSQYGYPVLDEAGNYSPNVLLDKLGAALADSKVYSSVGLEKQAAEEYRARQEATADQANDARVLEDAITQGVIKAAQDEIADIVDENNDSDAVADITEAQDRAIAVLGEHAVEAIRERVAIQMVDASSAEYNRAYIDALEQEIANAERQTAKTTGQADAGDGQGQRDHQGSRAQNGQEGDDSGRGQAKEAAKGVDLFGQDTSKQQSIADAARAKDVKRNGRDDVPVEAGEFFGQGGKLEADLFDRPTAIGEDSIPGGSYLGSFNVDRSKEWPLVERALDGKRTGSWLHVTDGDTHQIYYAIKPSGPESIGSTNRVKSINHALDEARSIIKPVGESEAAKESEAEKHAPGLPDYMRNAEKWWDDLTREQRIEAAVKSGWATAKGTPNLIAQRLTKQKWAEITDQSRATLARKAWPEMPAAHLLTGMEYAQSYVPQAVRPSPSQDAQHRVEIKAAIGRGDYVPPHVLAEYPDLAARRDVQDRTEGLAAQKTAKSSQEPSRKEAKSEEKQALTDDKAILSDQAGKHPTKDGFKSYLRGRLGKEKLDELVESGAVDRAWDEAHPVEQAIPDAIAKMAAAVEKLADKVDAMGKEATEKAPAESRDEKGPQSALRSHVDMMQRVRDGDVKAEEFKAAFEATASGRDTIIAELDKMTKPAIFKMFPGIERRYKNEKKADVIKAAYNDITSDFALGEGVSFTIGRGSYERAIRDMVQSTTDQTLADYAKRLADKSKEREDQRKEILAGMDDPKTVEDFQRLLRARKDEMGKDTTFQQLRMTLTPEQRARFDELAGEATRKERSNRKTVARTEVRAAGATTGAEIIATKHTRDGYDLFVVKAAERVERDVYNAWNAAAKKLGGWYSSFKGGGAVPGFQFKTREAAEAFQKYVSGGDTQAVQEQAQARRDAFADDRSQTAVERLREMADKMAEKADESLTVDRKANTARRARFAANAEAQANYEKAMAETMHSIAQAIEDGKAKFLDRVRTKSQIEMLNGFLTTAKYDELRDKYNGSYSEYEKHKGEPPTAETVDYAEFPYYRLFRSDWARLGRELIEKDGLKKLGQKILDIADDVTAAYTKFAIDNLDRVSGFLKADGSRPVFSTKAIAEESIAKSGFRGTAIPLQIKRGQHTIVLSPSEAQRRGIWEGDDDKRISINPDFANELISKINRRDAKLPWQLDSAHDKNKRLAAMGIETPAEFRAVLREFVKFREPPKETDKIKEMERAMIGRKKDGLDFFPTPPDVADAMVNAADIKEGMTILEPSAGMGHIADRIRALGFEPDVAELSGDRRELLEAKGYNIAGSDFLKINGTYDRIIMNPPFSDRRDMAHVQHAYNLLKPGGRLVAIMGEGVFFGSDKKAQEFRDWIESVGGSDEKLAEGTFLDPSLPVNTGASARLVVIDRALGDSSSTQSRMQGGNAVTEFLGNSTNASSGGKKTVNAREVDQKLSLAVRNLYSALTKRFNDGVSGNAKLAPNLSATNAFADEIGSLLNVPGRPSGSINSAILKAARDGASIDAKFFGDAIQGRAIRSNGFDSLDSDVKSLVQANVLASIHDDKVLDSVIELIPVDVMHDLIGKRLSSNGSLNDKAMLRDAILASSDVPVLFGRFIDSIAASSPLGMAISVAEEVGLLGDDMSVSLYRLSAGTAKHYGHDFIRGIDEGNYTKNARMVVIEKAESAAALSLSSGENFSPLSISAAGNVIARIRPLAQKLWNVDVNLAPTFDALPDDVKAAIAKYGEGTKVKGVLHNGKVHIVVDAHGSEADLETTILHEIKGHVGVRRLYGKDITTRLNALYLAIGGRKGLSAIAAKRGLTKDLTEYARKLGQSEFTDDVRTQIMMEEVLAHIAQEPKFSDRVKAIIGKVRAWLRDHKFMTLAEYGETDLLHIVSESGKALKTVKTDNGPAVLMVAWHGSPHSFDKFSTEHIGTGEGAQAYGHGLYFSGNKEVAEWYKKKLSRPTLELNGEKLSGQHLTPDSTPHEIAETYAIGRLLDRIKYANDIDDAADFLAKEAEKDARLYNDPAASKRESMIASKLRELQSEAKSGALKVKIGNLYEVELAPAPEDYLLWDKPLSEQSEKVKSALEKIDDEIVRHFIDTDAKASVLYKALAGRKEDNGAKYASDLLHSLGVRGIKYLDGSSRGKGEGDYNYVIFSDEDVTIEEKFSRSPKKSTGLPISTIENLIAPVRQKWKGVDIRVVQSESELPGHERRLNDARERYYSAQNAYMKNPSDEAYQEIRAAREHFESILSGGAEGFHAGRGVVYVVANKIPSATRLNEVLAHEIVGHHAVEDMLGRDYRPALKHVQLMEKAGNKVVREIAQQVDRTQPGLNQDKRAAEIIAVMAERGIHNSLMTRIKAAIQRFLRSFGVNIELNDIDLAALIREAGRRLERGDAGAVPGMQEAFSRGAKEQDNAAFANEVLSYLAEHDELFRYPVSQKTSLDGVMKDVFKQAEYLGEDTREDERSESGADRRFVFKTIHGKSFYVFERGDKVWIDVSRLDEGERGGGVYAAVMNYVHNAGKVFVGDPAGLSEAAIVRRTSNMLSSALRFGTTRHLEAAPEQVKGIPEKGVEPLDWHGDDLAKIKALIHTFTTTTTNQFPKIKGYRYDFGARSFVDASGRPVGRERFSEGAKGQVARGARAGSATLRRAIFLQSLISSESGKRPGILEQVLRRGHSLIKNGGLDGMFSRKATSWNTPEPSKLDSFLYEIQDKHIDTKRVIQAIAKQEGQIADHWNTYMHEALYHGRAASRVQDFLTDELEPLTQAMAKDGVTMEALNEYLHARHAKERNRVMKERNPDRDDNADLSGMSDEKADEILKAADPKMAGIANQIDAIVSRSRQMLVDYGLEKQETVDAWAKQYKHYVPLQREGFDDTVGGNGTGAGFSVRGKATKEAVGSHRAVDNIFANIAMQREKYIVRGEKNRVSMSLYGLAKLNPNKEFWKLDKPAPIAQVNHDTGLEEVVPGDTADYSVPKVRYVGKDGTVQERIDPNYKGRHNVINVRINGEDRAIIFNENDPRAVRMVEALKNLDADQLGEIVGSIGKVTRYFASINTQYNPVFGVVNLIRDTQTAALNLSSTPINGKRAEVIREAWGALKGIYKDARAIRKGKHPDSPYAELWEEFQGIGGQTGYRDMFRTSNDRAEAIQHMLDPEWWQKTKWGKALSAGGILAKPEQLIFDKVGKYVFRWLSDYNQAMENAVRLAAYKVGKEQGMSKERAAFMAKNLTVNFNKKGKMATQAGALYAFFNASVQGSARIAETLTHDANSGEIIGKTGKAIIYGGITLGAMQALALMLAGFDEDEPPEFVRERSLIIPAPGTDKGYLSIPMPLGFHVLPNIGRTLVETAVYGKPVDRSIDLLLTTLEAFNPVGGGASFAQTISPTVADPIVALSENRDWTGKPIYREDMNKLNPTPGFDRTKDSASVVSKAIAYGINAATGGSDYTPGRWSPTPDQIDYLFGQLAGGVGRESLKAMTTAEATVTGEELPTYKIPLVGRLVGTASGGAAIRDKFYDNLRLMNMHQAEIEGRAHDTGGDGARNYIAEHPESGLFKSAGKMESRISELQKLRRQLMEQGKYDKARLVETQINAIMTRFNEQIEQAKTKPLSRSSTTAP